MVDDKDERMSEYPPRNWHDIFAYDEDEVVAGYREYRPDEMEPGANRNAGYRWGWANRRYDITGEEDGFSEIRRQYINAVPGLFPSVH